MLLQPLQYGQANQFPQDEPELYHAPAAEHDVLAEIIDGHTHDGTLGGPNAGAKQYPFVCKARPL